MCERLTLPEALERTDRCYKSGFNCTQSVLQGLQAHYGFGDETTWQLVTGLGVGVGRRGFICGALTGGILAMSAAISRQRGSTLFDVPDLNEETYSKVQELVHRFEERFETVECSKLTGCDLLTEEGRAAFRSKKLMNIVCRPAMAFVVETVADVQPLPPKTLPDRLNGSDDIDRRAVAVGLTA